jgi:hypothetical protein
MVRIFSLILNIRYTGLQRIINYMRGETVFMYGKLNLMSFVLTVSMPTFQTSLPEGRA